jgi:hypothetical protein
MPATSTGPVGRSESDGAVGVAQGKTAAGQARMTPQPIALVDPNSVVLRGNPVPVGPLVAS